MTLFTQPGCSQCKMIHILLKLHKIEFEESQDLKRLEELGGDHTPTLEVDGKLLVGQELFRFINSYHKD